MTAKVTAQQQLDVETGQDPTIVDKDAETEPAHSRWLFLHAVYHCLVTILGTGILGFPHATAYVGYEGGAILITAVTLASHYTAQILVHLQEPGQSTYSDIADGVMGKGWSVWGVRPFQFLGFFPTTAVMILVGSQALGTMDSMSSPDGLQVLSNTNWVIVMGAIIFLLSLIPDLSSAWYTSVLGSIAAVLIAGYSVVGSSLVATENVVQPHYGAPTEDSADYIFGIMSAFGAYVFGYGFHSVLPDIQASLHIKDKKDRSKNTMKAVTSSVSFVGPAYLVVAMVGYAAFGTEVNSNILMSLNSVLSHESMYVIWAFVAVKVATEATAFNQGAFTLLRDTCGFSNKEDVDHHPAATAKAWAIEVSVRFIWAVLTTFTAAAIPFFGDLTAITSAISLTPLSFVLPLLFWNKVHGATAPKWRIWFHRAFVLISIVLAFCALIGGIYDIIRNAGTYKFFQ